MVVLLFFWVAGDCVGYLLGVNIPGPVIGMAALLVVLLRRGREVPECLRQASGGILQYLSLLFVPAGVGLIQHVHRLATEWPAILGSVVLGTALSLCFAALLLNRLWKSHD